MGKTEKPERSFLKVLQRAAQHFPGLGMALYDIVISSEYGTAVNIFNRQTFKELFQILACINIDVRSKFIAQISRQVIDKGLVAEMIFAFPVNAMGLEGITAVGTEQNDPSAGFQDPDHLMDAKPVVIDMFDDFMAQDQVIGIFFERQIFPTGVDDICVIIRAYLSGKFSPFKFNFDPDSMTGRLHKSVQVGADAAAVFQDVEDGSPRSAALEECSCPFRISSTCCAASLLLFVSIINDTYGDK